MFLLGSVVAVIILVMAAQYAEESKQILDKWGFLCGKKDRQVRNPRIEVSQVGGFMKGEECNLPWKHIKIDDQIVKLNGLPVVHLENSQIRAIMLLSCSNSDKETNETTVFSVEFTNSQIKEKQLLSPQEKKQLSNKLRSSVKTMNDKFEGLSPKEKRALQNKERVRPSVSTKNKNFEDLSPKEKKSLQNKERVRLSVSAKKDG